VVSLLRGKQFYYDEPGATVTAGPAVTVPPAPGSQTIVPNGPSLTSANGNPAPAAGAAGHTRQAAGG